MTKYILVVIALALASVVFAVNPDDFKDLEDDLESDLDEDSDACLPASCTSFGVSSLYRSSYQGNLLGGWY